LSIFRKSVAKIQVSLQSDTNNGYFTCICTFMTTCRILLGMRNFSDKSCTENQNIHECSLTFFPKIVPFVR